MMGRRASEVSIAGPAETKDCCPSFFAPLRLGYDLYTVVAPPTWCYAGAQSLLGAD